jgi:Domain of unknown function (DUF4145)
MAYHGNLLNISRCPHCSVDTPHLQLQQKFVTADFKGSFQREWANYLCNRCGGIVLAWSNKGSDLIQKMYPAAIEVDIEVPERAREYLEQSINSISAPAGAVMLAASAVDAMLKFKGLNEGTLYTRIELAVKQNLITEEMARWAHEVRLDANDQRHADENANLPTSSDADKVIEFTQALAAFLFVLPARVTRGLQNAQKS